MANMTDPKSFESLVEMGVYYVDSYDDEGEPQYNIDEAKAKELAPEVWEADQNAVLLGILDAVEQGYLTIDIDPNTLETTYIPTDKA